MKDADLIPVVLCGGAGTRLWPVSRRSFPKQFVQLLDGKSLLQLTLERVAPLARSPIVVTAEEHRFLVTDTLQQCALAGTLLLEPVPRNTAAAMALAALQAPEPQALLLFCPADHHIPDAQAFCRTVLEGVSAARQGAIVTFGVAPSFPSTAYGYIEPDGLREDGSAAVRRFIEKPNREAAEALILQGGVLWNAGIFLCSAKVLLQALAEHAPDILAACKGAMGAARSERAPTGHLFVRPAREAFERCRAESIDVAVLEKHAGVAVLPFRGRWSDVGSWNAVADLAPQDGQGNRIIGAGLAQACSNTYIHAQRRTVAAVGTRNLLIVETPDAVLVADRDKAEQVKEVVAQLDTLHRSEAVAHRKVMRPWGWYDSIDVGERFQVKRIGVRPGASLSLQMHHHRAEHWVVVRGTAEVTRGGETFLISENQSTYIPVGERHRLRNPGLVELEVIEVQSGSYLGEDDIVRFDDAYGRSG